MKTKILLFVASAIFISLWPTECRPVDKFKATSTTPDPNETEIEESEELQEKQDEGEQDAREIINSKLRDSMLPDLASLIDAPVSRDELKALLQRTIDYIDHRPQRERLSSSARNHTAKALGRLLLQEPDFGSTDDESITAPGQCEPSTSDGSPFKVPAHQFGKNHVSLKALKDVLDRKKKGHTEEQIRRRHSWYRRQYLPQIEQQVAAGGSVSSKYEQIDKVVAARVDESLKANKPIHDYTIRRWGLEAASQINCSRFFQASASWLYDFKKRHKIRSLAVTKYISNAQERSEAERLQSITDFLAAYDRESQLFPERLIWNMDQTGFNYEITNRRSLGRVGSRDHTLKIGQDGNTKHSYTALPVISRDGRPVGKLFLNMREPSGGFGPRIAQQVQELERLYGNIRVFGASSSIMTKNMVKQWIKEVIYPASRDSLLSVDTDTDIEAIDTLSISDDAFDTDDEERNCTRRTIGKYPKLTDSHAVARMVPVVRRAIDRCYNRPHSLLLHDSYGGHSGPEIRDLLRSIGIKTLQIPKKTTGDLQPLDVGFNNQYKRFVKIITEEAIQQDILNNVTSRAAIINLQSLIWNQLASDRYRDMLLQAWHKTDPNFSTDEFSSPNRLPTVRSVQFDGVDPRDSCQKRVQDQQSSGNSTCTSPAFIRCSHCGKVYCLKHFLERSCFHKVDVPGLDDPQPGPSGTRRTAPIHFPERDIPMESDLDDDFDPDLFRNRTLIGEGRRYLTTTTTEAPTTRHIHDELKA